VKQSEASARRERLLSFLAQDAGNTQLLAEIVDLDLALGLLGDAEEHLDHGLKLAPHDPQLLFQKAGLALRSGAADEAERLFRNLFYDRGIDAPGIRYSLAYTLMLKSLHLEAKSLLGPIAGNPETPDATSLLVRCLHFLGELKEAIAVAEKYLLDHPDDAAMMGSLSLLYTDINDIPEAKTCFLKALELDRNFAETHGGLAVIAVLQGRHEDAEQAIKVALKLDPKCFSALFARTLLLSRAGRGTVAAKMIEGVLTTTPVPGGGTLADMLKRVVNKQNRH
jgi:tetratricopeptide (TPR) repeat protein